MNKKKLNYENKKCKSCGSNLIFSPKHNALLCKNCGNTYTIEEGSSFLFHTFENEISISNEHNDWANETKMLKCQDCGAEIILDKFEYSSTCAYCGSNVVSKIEELPGLKPDAVIPFKFDGHDATLKFGELIKKKWFIPNSLKKKIPSSDMTGTYIACFSFNTNTFSNYSGIFSYNETYTNSKGESRTITHYVNVLETELESYYTVTDNSSYIVVDIYIGNTVTGEVTINYNNSKLLADNLNVLMADWFTNTGEIAVTNNTHYELIFFKTDDTVYDSVNTKINGNNVVINLN